MQLADLALWVALASTSALLLLYGLLQPWWRSWFGIGMVLTLFAVWQMLSRAALTTALGENYPGRDLVLLLGRTEIAVAMTVSAIYLGGQLVKDVRATWDAPESPGGAHRDREYS